jgi:hypothetical protein
MSRAALNLDFRGFWKYFKIHRRHLRFFQIRLCNWNIFRQISGPDSWNGFHPAMERIYVIMELGRDD